MAAPPIGVLLGILIRKGIFKRAALQGEREHIGRRERTLRQRRQEQLVDDASTGDANATLLVGGGMGRHHDPARLAARADGHCRTIREGASHAARLHG